MDIDEEWERFVTQDSTPEAKDVVSSSLDEKDTDRVDTPECPKASDIYISTKSKIAYLTESIDLHTTFWKLHVIPYTEARNGIVKKQMKFNSTSQEEVDAISKNLEQENYFTEQILTSVNEPSGVKNWFKDVRKISVGISKKDIVSYRCKQKCAFYNCFVMILRILIDDKSDPENGMFHEFHVKIFNTGKVEIPGIRSDYHLKLVLDNILVHLRPIIGDNLSYQGKCDTVLINSNFNCGFYIKREALFDILKSQYNIQCIYDPCSYPGIQCKFYYDKTKEQQTGVREHVVVDKSSSNIVVISFMIFRTGSILVVGMCEEPVLDEVYIFIKDLLKREFCNIYHSIHDNKITETNDEEDNKNKIKKTKMRKRIVIVDSNVKDE